MNNQYDEIINLNKEMLKMAFSNSVVNDAWERSGGKCECKRTSHPHGQKRCNKSLSKASRGLDTSMGWEAHHIVAGGADTLSNCEILCQDCHKRTRSYGG